MFSGAIVLVFAKSRCVYCNQTDISEFNWIFVCYRYHKSGYNSLVTPVTTTHHPRTVPTARVTSSNADVQPDSGMFLWKSFTMLCTDFVEPVILQRKKQPVTLLKLKAVSKKIASKDENCKLQFSPIDYFVTFFRIRCYPFGSCSMSFECHESMSWAFFFITENWL